MRAPGDGQRLGRGLGRHSGVGGGAGTGAADPLARGGLLGGGLADPLGRGGGLGGRRRGARGPGPSPGVSPAALTPPSSGDGRPARRHGSGGLGGRGRGAGGLGRGGLGGRSGLGGPAAADRLGGAGASRGSLVGGVVGGVVRLVVEHGAPSGRSADASLRPGCGRSGPAGWPTPGSLGAPGLRRPVGLGCSSAGGDLVEVDVLSRLPGPVCPRGPGQCAVGCERVVDLTGLGQGTLANAGGRRRHRRLEVGHETESGEDVVGSHGRRHVPYDQVKYRTGGSAAVSGLPATRASGAARRRRDDGGAGVEGAHPVLDQPLHEHLGSGQEGRHRGRAAAGSTPGQQDLPLARPAPGPAARCRRRPRRPRPRRCPSGRLASSAARSGSGSTRTATLISTYSASEATPVGAAPTQLILGCGREAGAVRHRHLRPGAAPARRRGRCRGGW